MSPTIAIVGSRDYPDLASVELVVARIARKYPQAVIVSGGARGVDRVAAQTARREGLGVIELIPDWNGPHKKAAGFVRNRAVVKQADRVIAAWDLRSAGTKHVLQLALDAGKPCYLVGPDGWLLELTELAMFPEDTDVPMGLSPR